MNMESWKREFRPEAKTVALWFVIGLYWSVAFYFVGCKQAPVFSTTPPPTPRTNRHSVVVFPPLKTNAVVYSEEVIRSARLAAITVTMAAPENLAAASNSPAVVFPNAPYMARGKIGLSWNRSRDTSVVGYRVYYGGQSGIYSNSATVGGVTNALITGLEEGVKYYFACQAYDSEGMESVPSNEATATTEFYVAIRSKEWIVESFGRAGVTNQILRAITLVNPAWVVVKEFVGVAGVLTNIIEPGMVAAYYRVRVKP